MDELLTLSRIGMKDIQINTINMDDFVFFFSSRRRHTRSLCDWSSDVCSSDLRRLALLSPTARRPPSPSPFFRNHPAQLGAEALDLGELGRDALEERGLRLDALVDEEGGRVGAAAEDPGLHELLQPLLRVVRDLDGDDVVVLGRERALDRAADVAADGGQRLGDARGDV